MTDRIKGCRACGFGAFTLSLDLGQMASCGVFPATAADNPPLEPIEVVRCMRCGLHQLGHVFDPADTFKPGFGYRSAGNPEMVEHLSVLAEQVTSLAGLKGGDTVIDIGSNDGTFLSFLPRGVDKIGVDPVSPINWTSPEMALHAMFWDEEFWSAYGEVYEADAAAVTCFACLYDVPDPLGFLRLVEKALRPGGHFVCEVAYLPAMIDTTGFDIVSHEHLTFFTIRDLMRLCDSAGLAFEGFRGTPTQGGSVLFWARKGEAHTRILPPDGDSVTAGDWERFGARVDLARSNTLAFLERAKDTGRKVHGLCASTKGAALLQVFGIGPDLLPCVAEKEPSKWGRFMPGSLIPIVSEKQSREERPDYLLVLSHQFRKSLIEREDAFLQRGGALVFPIPRLELVTA